MYNFYYTHPQLSKVQTSPILSRFPHMGANNVLYTNLIEPKLQPNTITPISATTPTSGRSDSPTNPILYANGQLYTLLYTYSYNSFNYTGVVQNNFTVKSHAVIQNLQKINRWHDINTTYFLFYSRVVRNNPQFTEALQFHLFREWTASHLLQTPVSEFSLNMRTLISPATFYSILLKYRHIQTRQYFILYLSEVIELFLLSCLTKHLDLIKNWVVDYFQRLPIKKHRVGIRFLQVLLGQVVWPHHRQLLLSGVAIEFRGKLFKTGSVRKRKLRISYGVTSLTQKKLRLWFIQFPIWTSTGSIGVYFQVTY